VANLLEEPGARNADPVLTVQAQSVLALARYELQQTDLARESLTNAIQTTEAKIPEVIGINWNDRMTAHLLLREARGVILGDSGKPAAQ